MTPSKYLQAVPNCYWSLPFVCIFVIDPDVKLISKKTKTDETEKVSILRSSYGIVCVLLSRLFIELNNIIWIFRLYDALNVYTEKTALKCK